jgi:hypothetical protein
VQNLLSATLINAVQELATTNSTHNRMLLNTDILELLDLFNPFSSHFTIFDVFLVISIITVLIAFAINIIKNHKSGA